MSKDLESADLLNDHIAESTTSASSSGEVDKGGLPLPLLMLLGLGAIVAFGLFLLSGQQTEQIAISIPTTSTTPPTSNPAEALPESSTEAEDRIPLPDRGGMRSIVEGWLTTRCDDLIDGPEPLLNSVYEAHLACLEGQMTKLEETCYLAARHYYQYPGEEALEVACAEPVVDEL